MLPERCHTEYAIIRGSYYRVHRDAFGFSARGVRGSTAANPSDLLRLLPPLVCLSTSLIPVLWRVVYFNCPDKPLDYSDVEICSTQEVFNLGGSVIATPLVP